MSLLVDVSRIVYYIYPHDPDTNEQIITGLTELGQKENSGTLQVIPGKGRLFLWACNERFYKALLASQAKGVARFTAYRKSKGGTFYPVKTRRALARARAKKLAEPLLKKARELRRRNKHPTPTPPVAA